MARKKERDGEQQGERKEGREAGRDIFEMSMGDRKIKAAEERGRKIAKQEMGREERGDT